MSNNNEHSLSYTAGDKRLHPASLLVRHDDEEEGELESSVSAEQSLIPTKRRKSASFELQKHVPDIIVEQRLSNEIETIEEQKYEVRSPIVVARNERTDSDVGDAIQISPEIKRMIETLHEVSQIEFLQSQMRQLEAECTEIAAVSKMPLCHGIQ